MEPQGTFGPRLRQERERRQISLRSIAANTKISQSLLEALERDDVSRWPSGIFRRAFVRSYANAVGLDADDVVKEFLERFPEPGDSEPQPETAPPARRTAEVERVVTPNPTQKPEPVPDHVELVFRVSVPRFLVPLVNWLAARGTSTTPRRQSL